MTKEKMIAAAFPSRTRHGTRDREATPNTAARRATVSLVSDIPTASIHSDTYNSLLVSDSVQLD